MAEPALVDLRSDTVTRPSAGMRRAMAEALVGDDVYSEDPTVNALEAEVAALFGQEAALFVPTGSMGNQIALRLLAEPGEEVLCDSDAHIVTYEMGAAAAVFGVQTRTVPSESGRFVLADYLPHVRPQQAYTVRTAAIAVENTHNRGGGTIQPLGELRGLKEYADAADLRLHCDGARIWNAHVATGVELSAYGELFDTLSVCLSKGLGAPIGSVLISDADRIARGRLWRKRLGGGMRQVGVLAAAGRYALDHNLERLADDHARAKALGHALAESGIGSAAAVETNVVVLDLAETGWGAADLATAAGARGVLISVVSPTRVRLLTHLDVDDDGLDRAVDVLTGLLHR